MAVLNLFVLTAAERETAMNWNGPDAAVNPRAVDNASPGVGANLNDNATDYEPLEAVTLVGKFVTGKRLVDDPDYQLYAPEMVAFLLTKPFCTLEPETIFLPDEPV
ncbi:MAG: hypothetical protein EOR57_14165 [Mesorhizobium sp.]|uniref:hypothetical protein n=1 Tax=Mesorhizobium sp. TaxID=1871066 RepID=UPI000FE4BF2B|nr:hypothetical protein [Mesorhizobium sp.]RWL19734.1 MAG: hypothetical protein EOR57_14165 [Mesorhizobium sp.]